MTMRDRIAAIRYFGTNIGHGVADAILAAVPGMVPGWQPIDTAPKDGSDVHVISKKWLMPVPAYFISRKQLLADYGDPDHMDEGWYPSCGFLFDLPEITIEPTHWMPLSDGPESAAVCKTLGIAP